MIQLADLLAKTHLTRAQIHYLRHLRLISEPVMHGSPSLGGSVSFYPDGTVDAIRHIKHLQARGRSLPAIARRLGGTTFVSATHNPQLAAVQLNLACIPNPQHTAKTLRAQVQNLLGGRQPVALAVRVAIQNGQPIAYLTGAFAK